MKFLSRKYRKYIILTGAILAVFIFLADWSNSIDEQLGNNVTLVVEIAVGILITIAVLWIGKVNEDAIETKIDSIKGYVDTIIRTGLERKLDALKILLRFLTMIFDQVDNLEELIRIHNSMPIGDEQKEEFKKMINNQISQIRLVSKNTLLDDDLVNPIVLDSVDEVSSLKLINLHLSDEFSTTANKISILTLDNAQKIAHEWLGTLGERIQTTEKEIKSITDDHVE